MQEFNNTCCFFGHRDIPSNIKLNLMSAIERLIQEYGVINFFVGNQGGFDSLALSSLKKLSVKYPEIRYNVVLAYLPDEKSNPIDAETLYPEGIENVPKRFCISWRNNWLIDHSQYVICYVSHLTGGASRFMELAIKRNRTVINLSQK